MSCENYTLDLSAIEAEINKIKDKSFKEEIKKKLEKVKSNPEIGEYKRYKLSGERAVKVNHQRYVMVYHVDEEQCMVIFDLFDRHDQAYKRTF